MSRGEHLKNAAVETRAKLIAGITRKTFTDPGARLKFLGSVKETLAFAEKAAIEMAQTAITANAKEYSMRFIIEIVEENDG